jgi:hypothetical protein
MDLKEINQLVEHIFNVDLSTLIEALKRSPNAQGYLIGAISEFLLQKNLESKGFVLKRITEKWQGPKLLRHHGDFYIRRKDSNNWYVLESKGLKSNAEKWLNLNKKNSLKHFLKKWNHQVRLWASDEEIDEWCEKNFEKDLERLKVKVLMTHFVSGKSKQRRINTSRNDEFDYVAVDLFLRTGKHEFIFANPKELPPSESDPNHLQQNYVIDVLIRGKKEDVSINHPWHKELEEIWDEERAPIKEKEMQVDERELRSWREILR